MNDEQLINAVAKLWVENGGDKDGLHWCLSKIADAIQKLIDSNNQEPK